MGARFSKMFNEIVADLLIGCRRAWVSEGQREGNRNFCASGCGTYTPDATRCAAFQAIHADVSFATSWRPGASAEGVDV